MRLYAALILLLPTLAIGANSTLQVNQSTGAIIGPITASQFATANGLTTNAVTNGQSGVTLPSGTFSNFYGPGYETNNWPNNGWGTIGYSDNIPYNSGSGSGLKDIPISPTSITGLMPIPTLGFWGYGSMTINLSQILYSNWVACFLTNGIVSAYSNYFTPQHIPSPLVMEVDAGWEAPHRTNNQLCWNTTNFPLGGQWLFAMFHSNYFRSELAFYAHPSFYTNGEVDSDYYGNIGGTNYHYPAVQLDTVYNDVTNFYGWGVDNIRIQDMFEDAGYKNQFVNLFDSAVLYPNGYGWRDTSLTNSGPQYLYMSNARPMAIGGIFDYPTAQFSSGLNFWALNQGAPLVPQPPTISTNNALNFMWWVRWNYTNNLDYIRKGGNVEWPDIDIQDATMPEYLAGALTFHAKPMMSPTTNYPYVSTNFVWYITNTPYIQCQFDPLCASPVRVYDNGSNNSIYTRQLTNGCVLVTVFNESTTNWVPQLTWSLLGLPSNQWYDVKDIFYQGSGYDFGQRQNLFNSQTAGLFNSLALLFTPSSVTQTISNVYGTPASGTSTTSYQAGFGNSVASQYSFGVGSTVTATATGAIGAGYNISLTGASVGYGANESDGGYTAIVIGNGDTATVSGQARLSFTSSGYYPSGFTLWEGPANAMNELWSSTGGFQGSGAGLTSIPVTGISATGTPSSSTFLRGDGTWQTTGSGGSGIPTLGGTGTNTTLVGTPVIGAAFVSLTNSTNTAFLFTSPGAATDSLQFYFGGTEVWGEYWSSSAWQIEDIANGHIPIQVQTGDIFQVGNGAVINGANGFVVNSAQTNTSTMVFTGTNGPIGNGSGLTNFPAWTNYNFPSSASNTIYVNTTGRNMDCDLVYTNALSATTISTNVIYRYDQNSNAIVPPLTNTFRADNLTPATYHAIIALPVSWSFKSSNADGGTSVYVTNSCTEKN